MSKRERERERERKKKKKLLGKSLAVSPLANGTHHKDRDKWIKKERSDSFFC